MLDILITKKWILLLGFILIFTGCNKEWEDEQYDKYLSFVHSGVTKMYVKYESEGGKKTYRVPVQVSGSNMPEYDINVKISVDPDTIDGYNFETFRNRTDLYYKPLEEKHYHFDPFTVIPTGESVGYIDVDFNFQGIDLYDNYFLALTVDSNSDLPVNPRKYYKKSLIHVNLFNDYSGEYSLSGQIEYETINEEGQVSRERLTTTRRTTWVADENTVFFYAGATSEDALNRTNYRVYMSFFPDEEVPNTGTIVLECPTEELIGFRWNKDNCYYMIEETTDPYKPYLKRVIISTMVDYSYINVENSTPEQPLRYYYSDAMIMQRDYNTLMPEEDQLQW